MPRARSGSPIGSIPPGLPLFFASATIGDLSLLTRQERSTDGRDPQQGEHVAIGAMGDLSRGPHPSYVLLIEVADAAVMCQSCIEIDEKIKRQRELLRSASDPAEIERINRIISKLYADRVLFHKNPED
jgi:hypothetical protein